MYYAILLKNLDLFRSIDYAKIHKCIDVSTGKMPRKWYSEIASAQMPKFPDRPTREYKAENWVWTLDTLDTYLILYPIAAPPWDVNLIYTRPDSNHINLTCSAFGVYPKPEVELSWGPG